VLLEQASKMEIKIDLEVNKSMNISQDSELEKPKSRAISRGKVKDNMDNNIKDRLHKEKEILRKAKLERQKIQEKMNKLEYEKS